jgi:hypothetical protein
MNEGMEMSTAAIVRTRKVSIFGLPAAVAEGVENGTPDTAAAAGGAAGADSDAGAGGGAGAEGTSMDEKDMKPSATIV